MSARPPVPLSMLATRLPHARVQGSLEVTVGGLTHDSRRIKPGDLFVCLAGSAHDGHQFAGAALASGASALLVNEGALEAAGALLPDAASILTVQDTRQALPIASCAIFGDPSHSMITVGVTGTNGKTTTTRMIAAIFRAAGHRVGTIGTLGAELDSVAMPSEHTTPEADQLQTLLAEMRDAGADAVVMEVSSHALAQHRTDGIAFSAGVFTNFTQDHLDYHRTMNAYFSAKARLFADYPVQFPRPDRAAFVAVINTTAWEGKYLATMARGEVVTFGTGDASAQFRAEGIRLKPDGAAFDAVYEAGGEMFRFPIQIPVGGAFQVGNALAAIATCLYLGLPWSAITDGLAGLPPVPGRFEAVPSADAGFTVIVDYAHTPDGLENVLRSARELNPARIILVFGCGGDRDRTKRPIMGQLGASLADIAIVTSDNPRHEQPQAIIDEILTGIRSSEGENRAEIHVEPDRRAAIHLALSLARPGDLVLIAGKGHEDYQIVGDDVLPFDDREVAGAWLALPRGGKPI